MINIEEDSTLVLFKEMQIKTTNVYSISVINLEK